MTQEDLDKMADERLTELMVEKPMVVILWMLAKLGESIIEANGSTMDLKTKASYNQIRYEVKAVIKVKKIKSQSKL